MTWNLSRADWSERIRTGQSLLPDLPNLDIEAADRAEKIFCKLRLPDVEGKPSFADAAGQWQRDIVRALFGSWDGTERHIREMFALVPKKSGKTTLGAAIMVTALLVNRRPRAEFLIVAPTLEVADASFQQAVGMIDADPVLRAKCHVQEHIRRITYRSTRATLKIKSFDPKVVTGTKPAGVLIDELHVIAEKHDADRVIGQLRGGMMSQPEGFLVIITTQSERPPFGVFETDLAIARAVRDGDQEASSVATLPLLYEFPPDVDWREPDNWWMVNPNLGRSFSVARLKESHDRALVAGEAEYRRWASQHLNVQIGLAMRENRWPGAEFWASCGDATLTLDALLERSEICAVGIDGGGLDDLLGVAVVGREKGTRRWLHWGHAWVHPIALERRKSIAALLRDYADDGDLTICDSVGDDVAAVCEIVERVDAAGLAKVGVDPLGIGAIVDALDEAGVVGDRVVAIPQGYRLMNTVKTVERKLADGTFVHGARPMMAWCVGNAKLEQRGNAVLISKQAAGVAKIDPLVALFNASAIMAQNPEASGRSIYDNPAAWDEKAAKEDASPDDGVTPDRAVLADPQHPDFAEHRERFNRAMALQDEDW